MGHELSSVNGRTAMMYVGEAPWHGLGTRLDSPATAQETIAAAGLDYDVRLINLTTTDGTPVPQKRAVIRTDTNDVLGVVGGNYVPVQNKNVSPSWTPSWLMAVSATTPLVPSERGSGSGCSPSSPARCGSASPRTSPRSTSS